VSKRNRCCVSPSKFESLLWNCTVWRVAVDGSEVDDKLCRNATGVVLRHPTSNVSCVDLRIAVLGDSAEGLIWDLFL
jgi:hypothetical protein